MNLFNHQLLLRDRDGNVRSMGELRQPGMGWPAPQRVSVEDLERDRRAFRCKHGVSGEDGCPDCDAEYLDSIERFESDSSAFAPFVPPGSQKEG